MSDDRQRVDVLRYMRANVADADSATQLAEWAADHFEVYEPRSSGYGTAFRPAEWIFEAAAEMKPCA